MADITPEAPQGPVQAGPSELPVEMPPREPEVYQDLSVFALLGFCLAVVIAGLVLLGGLVPVHNGYPIVFYITLLLAPLIAIGFGRAMRGERTTENLARQAGVGVLVWAVVLGLGGLITNAGVSPWSLGVLFWLPAALSLIFCLLGWAFIVNSEGTVTGEWYCRWGLFLTLFFGLVYTAYLSSISLAVASQARAEALSFLELLKDGRTLDAFVRTMKASNRGSNPQLLAEVENAKAGADPGGYTLFVVSDVARLLRLGGDDTKLTEVRYVALPSRADEAAVRLEYEVRTPYHEFDLSMMVVSEEITVDGVRRRSWRVVFNPPTQMSADETGTPGVTGISPTQNWLPYETADRRSNKAMVDFVQGVDRKEVANAVELLDFNGTWSAKADDLKKVRVALEGFFVGKPTMPLGMMPLTNGRRQRTRPVFEVANDGKSITVHFDVRADIGLAQNQPEFVAEGRLSVEGPFGLDVPESGYKVTKVKWDRIRKVEGKPGPPS